MAGRFSPSLLAAETDKANQALQSTEFWVTVGILVIVLLGAAFFLELLNRWRKRQLEARESSVESLTSFRALYEAGELTEEEYKVIRDRMASKVRVEVSEANPNARTAPRAPDPPNRPPEARPADPETS